jgi:hypothetical protein
MKSSYEYFTRQLTDWLFRRRSPALAVAKSGAFLAALGFAASFAVDIAFPSESGPVTVSVNNNGGIALIVSYTVGFVGVALILFGVAWEWIRWRREERRLERKRVIVIEVRGLRDTSGTPLSAAVSPTIEGRRDSLPVNLRQIHDGVMVEPEAAVNELASLPKELERRIDGCDRADVAIVYGGLAPVPLTFLTGVLVDDEGALTVMDWERIPGRWRALDANDDGFRFDIRGLQHINEGVDRVALAVTVSYAVDVPNIGKAIPEMPLVELNLREGSIDAHWSEAKQQALAKQFLDTVVTLGNRRVKEVHLFLAAPNSLVFSLGRVYDKRNLPSVTVYQYEQKHPQVFPWGVRMPVAGVTSAQVVRTRP